jgi:hypothetical protein
MSFKTKKYILTPKQGSKCKNNGGFVFGGTLLAETFFDAV